MGRPPHAHAVCVCHKLPQKQTETRQASSGVSTLQLVHEHTVEAQTSFRSFVYMQAQDLDMQSRLVLRPFCWTNSSNFGQGFETRPVHFRPQYKSVSDLSKSTGLIAFSATVQEAHTRNVKEYPQIHCAHKIVISSSRKAMAFSRVLVATLLVAVTNAAVNPENVSWAPTLPIPASVRARTKAMRAAFSNVSVSGG